MKTEKIKRREIEELADAKKKAADAKKVLAARMKLFNDKKLTTDLLSVKLGVEEASKLVRDYWNFFEK